MNEFLNFVMDMSNEIKKDKEELKQCAKEFFLPFTVCFTVIIGIAFSIFFYSAIYVCFFNQPYIPNIQKLRIKNE